MHKLVVIVIHYLASFRNYGARKINANRQRVLDLCCQHQSRHKSLLFPKFYAQTQLMSSNAETLAVAWLGIGKER